MDAFPLQSEFEGFDQFGPQLVILPGQVGHRLELGQLQFGFVYLLLDPIPQHARTEVVVLLIQPIELRLQLGELGLILLPRAHSQP